MEAITGRELLAMIEGPIGACKVDVEGLMESAIRALEMQSTEGALI